jgi:hypothetical protein
MVRYRMFLRNFDSIKRDCMRYTVKKNVKNSEQESGQVKTKQKKITELTRSVHTIGTNEPT